MTDVADPPTVGEPGRAAVRAHFNRLLAQADEWSLPDLTDTILELLEKEPETEKLLWAECKREVVYSIGERALTARRSRALVDERQQQLLTTIASPATVTLQTAGIPLYQRLAARKMKPSRFRWLDQPVLVAPRHHMVLGKMNRAQLDKALAVQERRLVGPITTYNMFVRARNGLADDAQTVDQAYDEQQLAGLWEEAQAQAVTAATPPALPTP